MEGRHKGRTSGAVGRIRRPVRTEHKLSTGERQLRLTDEDVDSVLRDLGIESAPSQAPADEESLVIQIEVRPDAPSLLNLPVVLRDVWLRYLAPEEAYIVQLCYPWLVPPELTKGITPLVGIWWAVNSGWISGMKAVNQRYNMREHYRELFVSAAGNGDIEAMRLVKSWRPQSIWRGALAEAAMGGHIAAMRLAKAQGDDAYNRALILAARGGHIDAMHLARSWGARAYEVALVDAAARGQIGVMTLARAWGATDYDQALVRAVGGGQIEAMTLLKSWGATSYNRALERASMNGHAEAMRLAKSWGGAINADTHIELAAAGGHLEAMKLLKDWGATLFDGALEEAASEGQLKAMELLKHWGATKFDDALVSAAAGGHVQAMVLAKTWGATAYKQAFKGIRGQHPMRCLEVAMQLECWITEAGESDYEDSSEDDE